MLFPVFEPDQPRDFFSGKYRGKKKRGFTCMVGRKMLKTWQIDLNFFFGGDFGFFNFYFTLENSTPPAPLSIDIIQVNPGIWFGSSMSSLFLSFPPFFLFLQRGKIIITNSLFGDFCFGFCFNFFSIQWNVTEMKTKNKFWHTHKCIHIAQLGSVKHRSANQSKAD